jgi:mycothiol system anti-sigma-R factor
MKEDCKKYFERISEYLDGELDNEICHEIENHLKECPECRECLDSLKKTIQLCKEAGKEAMPSDIRKRLRSNLKQLIKR